MVIYKSLTGGRLACPWSTVTWLLSLTRSECQLHQDETFQMQFPVLEISQYLTWCRQHPHLFRLNSLKPCYVELICSFFFIASIFPCITAFPNMSTRQAHPGSYSNHLAMKSSKLQQFPSGHQMWLLVPGKSLSSMIFPAWNKYPFRSGVFQLVFVWIPEGYVHVSPIIPHDIPGYSLISSWYHMISYDIPLYHDFS